MDQPGDQAEITIHFSEPAPQDGRWFKYDPIEATWTDYSNQTIFNEDRYSVTLYLEDGGEGDADGTATCDIGAFEVQPSIDVKPGSDPNTINLASNGRIAVAIFTTDDFDASQVDASTVLFAGANAVRSSLEDVDHDGDGVVNEIGIGAVSALEIFNTTLAHTDDYIKNGDVIFDLFVLLQTLEVVLWGRAVSMSGGRPQPVEDQVSAISPKCVGSCWMRISRPSIVATWEASL